MWGFSHQIDSVPGQKQVGESPAATVAFPSGSNGKTPTATIFLQSHKEASVASNSPWNRRGLPQQLFSPAIVRMSVSCGHSPWRSREKWQQVLSLCQHKEKQQQQLGPCCWLPTPVKNLKPNPGPPTKLTLHHYYSTCAQITFAITKFGSICVCTEPNPVTRWDDYTNLCFRKCCQTP